MNLVESRRGPGGSIAPRLLRRLLPRHALGDAIYAVLHYTWLQRRLPGRKHSGRLSDFILWSKFDGTFLDPLCQFVSDKAYARHFITAIVGEQYNAKAYQLLRSPQEVERMELTHFPCVVKPVHLSGQVLICHGPLDAESKNLVMSWMRRNYYLESREQHYKYLRPGVIVEEFVSDDGVSVPDDIKVFCFNGEPGFIHVDSGRFVRLTRNLYDTSWNRLPWTILLPTRKEDDPRPERLDEILEVARRLSAHFDFIRVDFYVTEKGIKVGELTNCPGSGGVHIRPREGEYALGRHLQRAD
ncbi:MAG: ATP-grasp fold amidoligase family protein [Anaerolineaceae bacterium]|nr:ATP-grasp fold amidoligase family protein [Anaerolineaceae bacterium]MCY4024122.1 ATP-grasp fold amidoligase family protein [Anaerolineaceae bacterium]